MASLSFSQWPQDKEVICQKIAYSSAILRRSPLKILLKTKNEPEMLERWIKHHQAIVGYENLIIIDNMSNDPAVIPAYEKYDGLITLFKYDTHFDLIHHPQHFPELYNALRECCDYFIFLDTDEYLIFFDGLDRFYEDERINYFIINRPGINIFPATSFQNEICHGNKFSIYQPERTLPNGLKWGKPIISTACDFRRHDKSQHTVKSKSL